MDFPLKPDEILLTFVKENKDLGLSRDKIQGTYWPKLEM